VRGILQANLRSLKQLQANLRSLKQLLLLHCPHQVHQLARRGMLLAQAVRLLVSFGTTLAVQAASRAATAQAAAATVPVLEWLKQAL
jgi:hypothetical protein